MKAEETKELLKVAINKIIADFHIVMKESDIEILVYGLDNILNPLLQDFAKQEAIAFQMWKHLQLLYFQESNEPIPMWWYSEEKCYDKFKEFK